MARTERRSKLIDEGGRQISATLNAAEAKLLKKHELKLGGLKAAVMAGLEALDRRNEISRELLLAEIERRLK